eukprot:TRINITY_DN22922_c0_g1_i1.p1 TRINITY_DN22922_c0_g1~~TRINITY_DN22922_c0_g1_i1.p1  ORF type:complete len:467 (-),score=53.50 TRINITY_DN22922_c0_g1_i1:171-1469(-)
MSGSAYGNVWLARAVNAVGGVLSGYAPGIIAPAQGFLAAQFELSDYQLGLLTSAILLGATVGSLTGGVLADKIGRKKATLAAASLSVAVSISLGFTPNWVGISILRIVLGVAVGSIGVVCPLYVSEIAPPDQRGVLNTMFQIFVTIGILVAYVVGYLLGFLKHYNWQLMFGLGAVPAAVLVIVGMWMPESDAWKAKKASSGESNALLNKASASQRTSNEGVTTLFSAKYAKTTFIGVLLPTIQQLTGINTIIYYAVPTFQAAGLATGDAAYATMGIGAWNVLTTLVSAFFVDKSGRRKLYLSGLAAVVVSLIVLAIINLVKEGPASAPIAIACLFVFIAGFELGPGPLFVVIENEIYPSSVREAGLALANILQWGFNLLISCTFLLMLSSIGKAGTYFIFGGIGLVGWLLVFFLLEETKGKVIDPIDSSLNP